MIYSNEDVKRMLDELYQRIYKGLRAGEFWDIDDVREEFEKFKKEVACASTPKQAT